MESGKYAEVSEMIFRFKESRDILIRRSVIQILPKLALFSPDEFVDKHAHASLQFLLDQLKVDRFRTVGSCTF
jgi:FKBP12-rapamycin complex-associated protein